MQIDVTTTSIRRHNILDSTYNLFFERMLSKSKHDFRLIINVDPVGESSNEQMMAVIERYFKHHVINFSDTPSFPMALKRVWSKVESKYFFNLEDDWDLNAQINFDHMLEMMAKYDLVQLSLIRDQATNRKNNSCRIMTWPYVWHPTDKVFLATKCVVQINLLPCLLKKDYIDGILPMLIDKRDPEWQMNITTGKKEVQEYMQRPEFKYGVYGSFGENRTVCGKKGGKWQKKKGLKKMGNFITYEGLAKKS